MSEHEESIARTRALAIQFGFPVYNDDGAIVMLGGGGSGGTSRCGCGAVGDHDHCPLD